MKTTKEIKESLEFIGVNRAKIKEIDHINVDIYVSIKHFESVKRLADESGIHGIGYNVKPLPFWACWFKGMQVIDRRK